MGRAMYCLRCGYNLRGLHESRCPERGLVFNPSDPQSFSDKTTERGATVFWISILSMICPLTIIVLLLTTWVVAGFQLGHVPIPMADDPKRLTGFAMSCYRFTNSLMDSVSVWVLASPAVLFTCLLTRRERKFRRAELGALLLAFMMPVFTMGLWISRVGSWFSD